MRIWLIPFLLLWAVSGLWAQSTAPSTAAAPASAPDSVVAGMTPGSRILKTFDFEETKLGNYEPIPMFWNKVAGRGYPLYTGGKFVHDVYRSANTSFQMQLDGGSVAYQFTPGKMPINPNADYYIVGFVKTTALPHARAELTGWFADEAGNLIASTEAHSLRWSSLTGQDDWHVLSLYMPGMPTGAAAAKTGPTPRSLVLQMGLLQPQQMGSQLGQFELYRQDILGAAWWDDLVVFQLPRLNISTPAVGNIFSPSQKPVLNMTVSDLGRDQLKATLTVRDATQKLAYEQSWALEQPLEQAWNKQVTLPMLPAGWYIATLDVADPKGPVIRRETRFVSTSDTAEGALAPARNFGLVATQWPVEAWPELPAIARQTGAGLLLMPAWRKEMSEESLLRKDVPFDVLMQSLAREDVSSIASFSQIPSALTPKLNERTNGSILGLLDSDAAAWKPYVSFLMARYATRVDLWQLGQEGDPFYSTDVRYAKLYQKTYGELSVLMTTPKLVIPWNALYDFDPALFPNAVLNLRIPSVIKPNQIPAYLESFQQNHTEVLAVIEPLPAEKLFVGHEKGPSTEGYARGPRLADFVKRILLARTCNPRAVMIDLPMTRQSDFGKESSQPEELALVYRTLVRNLAEATYRRPLNVQPGVRALLFDRGGDGLVALWNDDGSTSQTTIEMPLGKAPALLDYNGKLTPLPVNDGLTALTLTGEPLMIVHVDTPLVEMRGSFHLAASKIPAGVGAFETTVHFVNPYPDQVTGTLHIDPPAGWVFDPNSIKFSLAPKAELSQAVTLRYPYTEFAGNKTIRARLMLDRDQSGRPIDLAAFVAVSSDQVSMECFPTFNNSGELVLQQMITNLSSAPLSAQAYAMVPGMARQQRFVLDLKPGQTTIKRFAFPQAAALAGKAAALGLRQADGKTLITKAIPLN